MEPLSLAFAGLVLFLAYLVRGIAGFGSGLIAIPLLALVFPLQQVVPVVVFLDFVGSASQGIRNRDKIAWREQLPLVPFTFMGVAAGLTLLTLAAATALGQAFGVFVIVYAVYQLLPLPPLPGWRFLVVPFGFLGGFVGTLFGTGGPFYVIYFTLRSLEKSVSRATFAVNFLIDGVIRLAAYATFGFFQDGVLLAAVGALPAVALGLWIGGHIHTELTQQTYLRVISVILLISGTGLIVKNWG